MKYILFLIIITVLVYFNSFSNGFVWDDLNNIVDNEDLNNPVGLGNLFLNPPGKFFRPIPYLTLYFDHWLWGKNPFGYHLTNLFFHLLNVSLIFYLAKRLAFLDKTAFFTALLFAIHPIHTEAVTYISGRSDPICASFLLSSFCFYLNFLGKDKRRLYLPGSLFLFLLALFSKEIALIFPFILFLYHLYFLKKPLGRTLCPVSLFMLLTIIFVLLNKGLANIETGNVNSALKIFLFYIRLFLFPVNLHMQYNLTESAFLAEMPFFLQAIIFFIFIFVIAKISREKNALFGLSWFIIGILPFLGILKLNAEISEHWLYLPSFGLFLLAGSLLNKNLKQSWPVLSSLALIFCILTIYQNKFWNDDVTLYKHTMRYHPENSDLHYNLGNAYLRRGVLEDAEKQYISALKLSPQDGHIWNNLGIVLEKKGNVLGAYQKYKKAIRLSPELQAARENILRFQFVSEVFAQEGYFNHSLYGEVLGKIVKDGDVDYRALKDNPFQLNRYLNEIANLDFKNFESMSRYEKLAFYINVYNAFTIKVITEYYPVRSIKDIPGVWDKIKFSVAGRDITLNEIEHEILRKEFKEPRIHFALVCASKSCPKLATVPFNGKELNEQLESETKKFINDKDNVMLDNKAQILYLSSIFKWFGEDFGGVIEFISRYLPEGTVRFIKETKPRIRYLKYDWSLNEKL